MKEEYFQTSIKLGQDNVVKDCYADLLLPLLINMPNVTIRQHATEKNKIHIEMPFRISDKSIVAPIVIPVEILKTGAGFWSDILLLAKRVSIFYGSYDEKAPDPLHGGYSEKDLKEIKIGVVKQASDEMVKKIPLKYIPDDYSEMYDAAREKYLQDLKKLIYACIVASDSPISVTNKAPSTRRS